MYFVDLKVLHQRLAYMEQLIRFLLETKNKPETFSDQLAFERALHVMIEIILDVGHQMIDGFMMRDPGSFEDVLAILVDEQVLSSREGESLKGMISYRKSLVQHYVDVDHHALWTGLAESKEALQHFPQRIRDYLHNQMGPVHAFKQGD
jgi:uncharacterized protein YutE (UPF0331/DUF86 family)